MNRIIPKPNDAKTLKGCMLEIARYSIYLHQVELSSYQLQFCMSRYTNCFGHEAQEDP